MQEIVKLNINESVLVSRFEEIARIRLVKTKEEKHLRIVSRTGKKEFLKEGTNVEVDLCEKMKSGVINFTGSKVKFALIDTNSRVSSIEFEKDQKTKIKKFRNTGQSYDLAKKYEHDTYLNGIDELYC